MKNHIGTVLKRLNTIDRRNAKKSPGIDYDWYIHSDKWRDVRERYFNSKLPQRCWGCDKPRGPYFELHHRTYKRLGQERLTDLVLLCPECHQEVHKYHDKIKHKKSNQLWGATNTTVRRLRKQNNLPPDPLKKRR